MASGVATTIANVAVTGISYPVYLHFLGYEKYGVWLVLATILSFTQLSNLGIGSAVMKLVAEEHGKGDIKGIQSYVTTAILSLCTSGTLALLVMLCFKSQIIGVFKLTEANAQVASNLLPYMGLLTIYVFVVQVFSATLSGLGRMDLANYSDTIGRIIALGTSSLLLAQGRGIESLFIGNVTSYIFILLILLFLINRINKFTFLDTNNLDIARLKKLLKLGSGMFGSALISMLLGPFNKLMISRWVGVSSVPIYEIAFNGTMQIRSLIEAGFRAMSPEISRISTNMEAEANKRIVSINSRAMKIIWIVGLPFWSMLVIFVTPLLKIWLRTKYIDTLPVVFQIMLVGTFLSLLGVPSFYTLMGLGRTSKLFISNVIQSSINALLITVIILIGTNLSIYYFVLAVTFGMGSSTLYLITQKHFVTRSIFAANTSDNL